MAELGQLALHLPGLLSLLGEHLYSDPRVAFRELVQNAHDSVVRRRLELADDGDPVIRVRSYREGGRAYVCISDRGLGLTKSEIERFLATIGRGQTRELRAALSGSGGDVRELVGQFGVGLLSAFLVADQVRVRTRRAGGNTAETDTETDTEGWEWVCDGQQTYRLAPFAFSDPDRRGSDVVIRLRPDKEDAGASGALFRAIQHYCGFLPCPIEVDGEQLNREVPAWIAGARAMPAERLARLACGDEVEAPLARMALKPFTHAEYGDIDLQGVLVIPPDSHLSIREYGGVRVYIRHMLVTPRESELLPQWARFVCGLIDCPQLEPTASREAVRRNPLFHAVRVELGRQLLDFLRVLKQQPDWADVVRAHATLIKRDAVRSAVLFDAVSDEIPFETSQGTLTLPQVLERSNGTLYCYTDSEQARTMSLLLGASAIPVIDGRWYANAPFLRFYAEMRGVALVSETPTTGAGIVEAASGEDLPLTLRDLQEPGLVVRPSRFSPPQVAMFLYTPHALKLKAFAEAEAEAQSSPMAALLGDYAARAPVVTQTLYINVDHPLLRIAEDSAPPARQAITAVLKEHARVLAGDRMEYAALVDSCTTLAAGLEALATGEHS